MWSWMDPLWATLEATPIGAWMDASSYAYPLVLTIHGLGMAAVVGLTLVIALRVLGFPGKVPLAAYSGLMPLLLVSFACNAATGAILFMADAQALAANPSYQIKMGSIIVGLLLLWRLTAILKWAEAHQPAVSGGGTMTFGHEVLPRFSKTIAVSAILVWWLSVIVSGRLVAYISPPL